MRSMSRTVINDTAKGRTSAATAAALVGLLVLYVALPFCSSAFTCTMPSCADASQPMEGHDAMPPSGCSGPSSGCTLTGGGSADSTAIVLTSSDGAFAIPTTAPRLLNAFTNEWNGTHTPFITPRANARHLYVLNDVFLI